jgi:hypothetical protein
MGKVVLGHDFLWILLFCPTNHNSTNALHSSIIAFEVWEGLISEKHVIITLLGAILDLASSEEVDLLTVEGIFILGYILVTYIHKT